MSCEEELVELKKINSSLVKINQELEQKLLELYTLYSISRELSDAAELEEMLNATMSIMKDTLGIDSFIIYLKDEITDFFVLQSAYGVDAEQIENIRISSDKDFLERLKEEDYLITNMDDPVIPIFSEKKMEKEGRILLLPFISNELIGFIGIIRKEREFEEYEKELFSNMSAQLTMAIEKFQYQKKIQDMIIIDPETGLYNRKFFFDALKKEWERARRYKRYVSLIMIKLTNFNEYFAKNGSYHAEIVIRSVARTISGNVRFSDILSRFGIDEFGVILPETDLDHAEKAARKILDVIRNKNFPDNSGHETEKITLSIGISSFPQSGEEPLKILNSAIEAMKLAQSEGPNKIITA